MKKLKIIVIREGKIPHDKRVALSPEQVVSLQKMYPQIEVIVQPSQWRSISDTEYNVAGINVSEDISDGDIFLGIKEVPVADLVGGKQYLFFSHTIKKQEHNKKLLQAIISKKVQLIDYECLVDDNENRIIGFGRYAGLVGTYNTIRAYGLKYKKFKIKPAQECEHKADLERELKKAKLSNIKILVTGGGRVANGAIELMGTMKIRRVTPYEFLMFPFNEPVYAQVHSSDYHYNPNQPGWDNEHFHNHAEQYLSAFKKFTEKCDLLLHCAFWNPKAPKLFSFEEMADPKFRIKVIGDITCDIDGSIPSTTAATTIENPYFDYNAQNHQWLTEMHENTITTMAVDNLPCSLPRDASENFGQELMEKVLPLLIIDPENDLIQRASITKAGKLTQRYQYLQDFVA
jgi:saccharopine dehydrogenase (NAD+, L-lysine-forming)